jgi:putative membrane protein
MRRSLALTLPFLVLASFAFVGTPGSGAQTFSPPNKVVDYQTVAGMLNSDGSVDQVRLLDDLRLYGTGDVTVNSPNSITGVRDLLGYAAPQVVGGKQLRYSVQNLDGSTRFQTMTTPDRSLMPLSMAVKYTLDGRPIAGSDLVGKTGDVGISFTVKNVSSRRMDVTYRDSTGRKITKPMMVPLPIIGQLQVTLPPAHFTNIESPLANVATDPFGNKIMAYSFVLFPPLGDLAQTVTLKAQATDFALGQVQLAGMPVAPKSRPELDYAEIQLAQGSDQASTLVNGANLIAKNLNKVYAGTSKLLAGLEKLYKGALKLSAGLTASIAPGGQLMGGIDTMRSSLRTLATGVKANGPALSAGVRKLDTGLAQMQSCLTGDGKGQCKGHSIAGLFPAGLVVSLQAGLNACLTSYWPGLCPFGPNQNNDSATRTLGQLKGLIDGCLSGGATACKGNKSLQVLAGEIRDSGGCQTDTACADAVDALESMLPSIQTDSDQLTDNGLAVLQAVMNGRAKQSIWVGLEGIKEIADGLSAGIGSTAPPEVAACAKDPAKCSVRAGLAVLLQQLVGGFGSDSPAAIKECLADRSKCTLLSGVGAIVNGLGQLQTGLKSGIGEAATGAGTLATCIGAGGPAPCQGNPSVESGVSQVNNGVFLINEQGVKVVAASGTKTQLDVAQQYGLLRAEDTRAQEEAFLYGTPTSHNAATVVGGSSYVLMMDALDGRNAQTTFRAGLGVIVLLLAFGLGFVLKRRTRPRSVG